MEEDRYQTHNGKQNYRTSRKIAAKLEGKRYAGKHKKSQCPYHNNVVNLRLPIDQRSWAIKTTIVQNWNEYRCNNECRCGVATRVRIHFLHIAIQGTC